MSSLEVYAIQESGDVTQYARCRNSWGGAIHIWNVFARRLGILRQDDPYGVGKLLMNGYDEVWQATDRLSSTNQWVMRSTFDQVVVPKDKIEHYRVCLEDFCRFAPTETLAALIAVLHLAEKDDLALGVCFNWTSVAENLWWKYGEEDEEDEEDEEGRPYNVNTDTGHWYINEVFAEKVA